MLDEFLILFLDGDACLGFNHRSIVGVVVIRGSEAINVRAFVLLKGCLRNVDEPVSCHGSMASLAVLKDLFFINGCNPDVVILAPYALVVIFDEGEVMATISATIMHTNCMQVVWDVAQTLVRLIDSVCDLRDLRFKRSNLSSSFLDVPL